MRKSRFLVIAMTCVSVMLISGIAWAKEADSKHPDIYTGYYSQEGNYGELGETSGHSHYVKFYPPNRMVRMFIPFPYSKTVRPDAISMAFNAAVKRTSGSAYIRDKFGVLEKAAVVHLDTFRWVDGQVMYDCSNAAPCKINFDEKSMTIIKPGVVLEHEILYDLVKD